jgi:hypothetical protein
LHRPGADPVALGSRGGIASGETRREQGKSVRDRLREKVELEFEAVWAAFEDGMKAEETRDRVMAVVSLLAEAYGKPPLAIVGDPEAPVRFELVSAFAQEGDAA